MTNYCLNLSWNILISQKNVSILKFQVQYRLRKIKMLYHEKSNKTTQNLRSTQHPKPNKHQTIIKLGFFFFEGSNSMHFISII